MRTVPRLGGLAAVVLAVAACDGLVRPPEMLGAAPPARLLVYGSEFRLDASRRHVPAGTLVAQLHDAGEDDHDLVISRAGSSVPLASTPIVHAGGTVQLRVRLRPGRYRLWCSVADHAARGMQTTLVVRPRRAP